MMRSKIFCLLLDRSTYLWHNTNINFFSFPPEFAGYIDSLIFVQVMVMVLTQELLNNLYLSNYHQGWIYITKA